MATDGGNSSGVSRALIKDRLIFHPREPFSSNKNFVVHPISLLIMIGNRIMLSGSSCLIFNLRSFIKNNLSGQFLTQSCGSL